MVENIFSSNRVNSAVTGIEVVWHFLLLSGEISYADLNSVETNLFLGVPR